MDLATARPRPDYRAPQLESVLNITRNLLMLRAEGYLLDSFGHLASFLAEGHSASGSR